MRSTCYLQSAALSTSVVLPALVADFSSFHPSFLVLVSIHNSHQTEDNYV